MKRDSHHIFGPCHELEEFHGDAEQLRQVVPAELAEPLESLLHGLANIRRVRQSFGKECLNVIVAQQELEKDAIAIEKACAALWRDA